jgi:hypothetical protein
MNEQPSLPKGYEDFSLVMGGPIYQIFLRSRIARPPLGLLERRIATFVLVTWLPLLVLSAISGTLFGDQVHVSFLRDFEAQARFLIAVPILLAAEGLVHQRIRPLVQHFVASGVVRQEQLPLFRSALDRALRIRNSVAVEVVLLVLVFVVGPWAWHQQVAVSAPTWYATGDLTPAGFWYAHVSIPLFQFLLLRWYLRLFIWYGLLWKVSRLDLHLTPTHPDRAGGLGFLVGGANAFMPVLFAQGAVLAGLIASRILYGGAGLLDFKAQAAGSVAFFVLIILGPLLMFTPQLTAAKRQAQREYSLLAARYGRDFENKWIRGTAGHDEPLLGSADVQSLADLVNSFQVVREMRPVPFGWDAVTRLAISTAAPLIPLGLTVMPLAELVEYLFKVLV